MCRCWQVKQKQYWQEKLKQHTTFTYATKTTYNIDKKNRISILYSQINKYTSYLQEHQIQLTRKTYSTQYSQVMKYNIHKKTYTDEKVFHNK